jgi:hypothetical protein
VSHLNYTSSSRRSQQPENVSVDHHQPGSSKSYAQMGQNKNAASTKDRKPFIFNNFVDT